MVHIAFTFFSFPFGEVVVSLVTQTVLVTPPYSLTSAYSPTFCQVYFSSLQTLPSFQPIRNHIKHHIITSRSAILRLQLLSSDLNQSVLLFCEDTIPTTLITAVLINAVRPSHLFYTSWFSSFTNPPKQRNVTALFKTSVTKFKNDNRGQGFLVQ